MANISNKKTRILVADDHAVVREGFRRLVEATPGLEVVAEAETGEQAVSLFEQTQPDLVIMDLSMPGIDGIEALRRIMKKDPRAHVIIVSVHDESSYVKRVLEAGARGYLSKRAGPEILTEAIVKVANGERFIEPSLASNILLEQREQEDVSSILTDREFETFLHLAKGLSVAGISKKLHLSPKTVGAYQTRIFRKLNISNTAELTRLAIRNGLIEP